MNRYDQIEQTKENYRSALLEPEDEWPWNVRKANNCIKKYLYAQKLTVGWIKEKCQINGHNFSTHFKYYLGRTPKQYILYHRIAVAKQLLANQKLERIPISSIAYELGFSAVSTFSKCFKRQTGTAPSRWRNEKGKG